MYKIIIVEDDTFLSKMYYEKLSLENIFQVFTAESGRRALELIQKEVPNLVLLDVMLPDVNGIQVLKEIKKDKELSSVHILMLSNLNEKEYISEALDLGADGYLIKAHFTPDEVVDKIKQVLREE